MIKRKRGKYCPKCGAKLKQSDTYCTECRYSFKKRKKLNARNIILVIIIIIAAWASIRYIMGSPIIPQSIMDIFANKATG